jgi:hypothetical protein
MTSRSFTANKRLADNARLGGINLITLFPIGGGALLLPLRRSASD